MEGEAKQNPIPSASGVLRWTEACSDRKRRRRKRRRREWRSLDSSLDM
jgi:hypothetical protein